MKKFFTLLLLCALIPMGMKAQDGVTEEPSFRLEESDEGKTLTIYGTGDLTKEATNLSAEPNTKAYLKDVLREEIIEGINIVNSNFSNSFETVKFVNESADKTLIIDNDIVYAILYPMIGNEYYQSIHYNNSIQILDLGATLIRDLNSKTFYREKATQAIKSLSEITLPLTEKTEVYNDATGENVNAVIVPSSILSGFKQDQSNIYELKTINIPSGYEWIGKEAFQGNNTITTVNFPTTVKVIGESAFEDCFALTNVNLNEGLQNIGKKTFRSSTKETMELTKITFPSTLRIINDGAFYDCRKLIGVKFNDGLYFIGNGAFGVSSSVTAKSLEIPASVRYIGPGAFYWRRYQDVYFYGVKAPLMPLGTAIFSDNAEVAAFSNESLEGNNGFQNGKGNTPTVDKMYDDATTGYANRENYKNNNTYFCILHYPKGLDDDARAEYTDITRVYITGRNENGSFQFGGGSYYVGEGEENLSFGGNTASTHLDWGYEDTYLGSQYIWPSQSQWERAYIVSSCGYNWDGKTKYNSVLSDEDIETLAYAGFVIGDGEGQYTKEQLSNIAHIGTRQFVFTYADVTNRSGDEENPTSDLTMDGGKWWTICVPFDMTKKQIDDVFGIGTHVCRFSSVSRTDDGSNKSIVLRFQNDVYATKWLRDDESLLYTRQDGEVPTDDDIVIYSHEAYMIRPTKSDEDATVMINFEDYENVPGSPYPTIIKANADNKSEDADHTEYRFVGNYMTEVNTVDNGKSATTTIKIPQYSYIYAKKKTDTAYKFWFITDAGMAWSSNKCIVQATARDRGLGDYKDFFAGDAFNSKVSQMSLFGDDDNTTGIESVTIIAGEGKDAQIVYSLDGRQVSTNGSLDNLGRGVYIRGGKKYVVR